MDCHVRNGSIATDEVEVTRSRMSASPLKADNLHTISASPLSAISGHSHCSKEPRYSITSSAATSDGGRSIHRSRGRAVNKTPPASLEPPPSQTSGRLSLYLGAHGRFLLRLLLQQNRPIAAIGRLEIPQCIKSPALPTYAILCGSRGDIGH